ncbi:flagellar filament capping protein FliD [Bordetella avium]|uniref:flagellar filament capping protein FliD n=1 Tax=Bordetella avium TaxID=521 RepID=UPI000E0B81CD|nr:flagellar filament capping protein FliD [Bordetella avium]AZY49097.1 flagellar hook protein FliD [Bordetella avium]AZY52455.1 flagellar hook protein FliD [Bordetella avium]RIQ12248.1 flagellar hook protein FliD [Bordetella avium]RIQ19380.1 flagellar hook protein FliD [Bordetella avium]RIQ33549.1 flagellar hook protein FliD [Bordetella avium]
MATISSLGSSGLPLQETLDKLQEAEERRLKLITNQQSSYQTRVSAFGKIQSAVEALQKAAANLGDMGSTSTLTTKVTGNDGVAVATANGAMAGTYNIKVSKLATAQSLQSQAFNSRIDNMGTGGVITFTVDGKEKNLTLGSDTSLGGIAKSINGDDALGLSATIVNDGQGKYYLMVTSKSEGEKAAVTKIAVTGNNELASALNYDASAPDTSSMKQMVAGKNAELSINGIPVVSQTNAVTTAIDGVTLTLTAVTPENGAGSTVTIAQDNSKITPLVQAFVTAYNSLQTTIADLTAFNVDKQTQSALTGDGATRSIQSSIAAALRVVTGEGSVQTLGQLGITSDPKTGALKLDNDKLIKALNENPADAMRVFTSKDNGLAARVSAATDKILGDSGTIKSQTDGLEKTIASLKKQYESTSTQIEATMANYRNQFVKLDALVSQLKVTSNYLSQQFASLSTK